MKTNILVPIDFSGVTAPVLREAATLADVFDAKLWLIHVAPPDPEFVGFDAGPQMVRELIAAEIRRAKSRLERYQRLLAENGLESEALVVSGQIADKVLEKAEELDVDRIVLGSHGRGALYQMLVGSVCERVLRRAHCSVVVVPDPARRKKRPR